MNHKGQSLIEVLIAVTVVVIVLVALAGSSTRAVSDQISARQRTQATKLSEEQIERVRTYRDRNGLSALGSCSVYCNIDVNLVLNSTTVATDGITVWYSVGAGGASCPDPASKWIDSHATWNDSGGTRDAKISTCLSGWKR